MTERDLRQKVVSIAQCWLGTKEGSGGHHAIIDTYNGYTPRPRGYKVTYKDSWCAAFVSAVAIKAGLTAIMPVECSCGELLKLYKARGRWVENDAYVPSPGDLILYDWQDTGIGDCTGAPDHVGLVEQVTGKTVTVIEGNYNDMVGRRILAADSRSIRGYCCPDYASRAAKSPEEVTVTNTVSDGVVTMPDYWLAVLRGERTASAANVKALMDKYHEALGRR